HSPLPCRRAKRQSGFLEAARTGHRSHAQGRGARGVSETQRHCLAKVCSPPIAIFFLDRWNAWVQVGDLAPMKKLAKTITAKSEGILRSIATGLSIGVLEAINGNVQAAKRKAKGYRTKRNLKAIVYLIAGDVLANSPT